MNHQNSIDNEPENLEDNIEMEPHDLRKDNCSITSQLSILNEMAPNSAQHEVQTAIVNTG